MTQKLVNSLIMFPKFKNGFFFLRKKCGLFSIVNENQTKEIANIYHVLQCINLPTVFESGYYLLFSSTFYTQESHSTERLRNLPLYVIQQVSPESRFKFRESDSGAQELNHSSRVSPSGLQCWFLSLLLWCVWFSVSFGAYYLLTFIR